MWFELGNNFGKIRSRKKARSILYNWQIDKLQGKEIRNEYLVEFVLHASEFFETLKDLHQKQVDEEEFVSRMASKWEKVVDKAASIALGS